MRAVLLVALAALVAQAAAGTFNAEKAVYHGAVPFTEAVGLGAVPIDTTLAPNYATYLGPTRFGASIRVGYSLSAGGNSFGVFFMDTGDFNLWRTSGKVVFYTAYSVQRATSAYLPPVTGYPGADSFYLLILNLYVSGSIRVTGSATLDSLGLAVPPTLPAPAASPLQTASWTGPILVSSHMSVLPVRLSKPSNISIMPGERWVSTGVTKGKNLDIGYLVNGTNRFNILLVDKDNLTKIAARQLFTYYPFYSRTDVFGAHLELETILELPADLFLVINCVDSFQPVTLWGDITFEAD
jgi:hypothetical protein